MPRLLPRPASFVDKTSQNREKVRHALDLIEDDETACESAEIKFRVGQLGQVRGAFQIEVMSRFPSLQFPCQSGFTHLPGSQQCHHRRLPESLQQGRCQLARNHFTLKFRNRFRKFKVKCHHSRWQVGNGRGRQGLFPPPPIPLPFHASRYRLPILRSETAEFAAIPARIGKRRPKSRCKIFIRD
jgi:hypothetical protein